jgi:hypothetical protein
MPELQAVTLEDYLIRESINTDDAQNLPLAVSTVRLHDSLLIPCLGGLAALETLRRSFGAQIACALGPAARNHYREYLCNRFDKPNAR